jgi:hypothetical protein
MRRREFLTMTAAAPLASAQQKEPAAIVASATVDTTPRVAIVLSSFREGADHDGTPIRGLEHPRPVDADLSSDEIQAMVHKAIELAATRTGDLASTVEPDAWVVIKTHIPSCFGLSPETSDGGAHRAYIPGSVTDPRIVRAVICYLAERKRGLRFTVAEGSAEWLPVERSKSSVDGWNSKWGGAFGGLSYHKLVEECSNRFPGIRFEIADLNFADTIELPVRGKALARNNPRGVYTIPKLIQQCDRLITVAPMATDPASGVSLSVANFLGIAPGSRYGFPKDELMKLGSADEIMIDLFGYHPADFAVVGGSCGVEGEGPGPGGTSVHHNLLFAGAKAVCVDAVAAAVMGFNANDLPFLMLAERRGLGIRDVDGIWIRGNEIADARRTFRRPSRWRATVGRPPV